MEESCGRGALRAEYRNWQVEEQGEGWGKGSSSAFQSLPRQTVRQNRGVRNSAAKMESVEEILIM